MLGQLLLFIILVCPFRCKLLEVRTLMEFFLDCGLTHLRNDYLRGSLKEKAPDHADDISKMVFGEILE